MADDRQTPRGAKGPYRENVPGELEHASGEVEEFEADLISGAEGASLSLSGATSGAWTASSISRAAGSSSPW